MPVDQEAVAQSNVDLIEHCLNTPPNEHIMECEDEWWHDELGEQASMYMGAAKAFGSDWALHMALMAWSYRRNPDLWQ